MGNGVLSISYVPRPFVRPSSGVLLPFRGGFAAAYSFYAARKSEGCIFGGPLQKPEVSTSVRPSVWQTEKEEKGVCHPH